MKLHSQFVSRLAWTAALAWVVQGCGNANSGNDAGTSTDAGQIIKNLDAGPVDAGFPDAGPEDAGAEDAGSSCGGEPACSTVADCPVTTCFAATCTDNCCGTSPLDAGATCSGPGGNVCDGKGNCVGCVSTADCAGGSCSGSTYFPPQTCVNNACVTGAQQSCPQDCDADAGGCVQCNTSADCAPASCSDDMFTSAGTCMNNLCVVGNQQPCTGPTGVCDPNVGCVQCTLDSDCTSFNSCDGTTYVPGACSNDTCGAGTPQMCADSQPVCDTAAGCVQCNTTDDCPGASCSGTFYSPAQTCSGNACVIGGSQDCSAFGEVCNVPAGGCVRCGADTDCSGTTPACNTSSHSCVQCTNSSQSACASATPAQVCGASTNTCIDATLQVDLSSILNVDTVASSTAVGQSFPPLQSMDGSGYVLMTESVAESSFDDGAGLPDNGFYATDENHPNVQLAFNNDSSAPDAIILGAAGSYSTTFEVTEASFDSVQLYLTSTEGNSSVMATLTYSDNTTSEVSFTVPDWFDSYLVSSPVFVVQSGLSRYSLGGDDFSDSAALYGLSMSADKTRVLQSVTVTLSAAATSRLVLYGATAILSGASPN